MNVALSSQLSLWVAPVSAGSMIEYGLYGLGIVLGIAALVWWLIVFLYRSFSHADKNQAEIKPARLMSVLNAAPDPVLVIDRLGRIDKVNPAALAVFGYPQDELIGATISQLMTTQARTDHDDYLRQHNQTGLARLAGQCREIPLQTKQGKAFPAEVTVAEMPCGESQVFTCILRDLSHRKKAQIKLRRTQVRLRLALHTGRVGVWEVLLKSGKISVSGALFHRLVLPGQPLNALDSWMDQLHPDDQARWRRRALIPLPDELENAGVELRFRSREGGWRWLLTHAHVSERDAQGQPVVLVGTCVDITERKHAAKQLRHAAQHDNLTGLANRALVFQLGERLLAFATRHKQKCAVLLVDLERFKNINDRFGHGAGDAALQEVADRLQRCVRQQDVVGRLGSDEFLIILAEVHSPEGVTHVANDIQQAVSRPILFQNHRLQVSPSIGISLYPTDGRAMEGLVKHADAAMVHAKKSGYNQVRYFSPYLNVQAKSLLQLETRLRQAIHDEAFTLYYQPMVDTQTHRVIGVEALLRWPGGNISPEEFIPVAEASGLIGLLGDWVMDKAFRQQARWANTPMSGLKMAVNVSPVQFRQKHFARRVERIMSETGVKPDNVQLEMTENALLHDQRVVLRTLHALHHTGLAIVLDDFGKDHSNLNDLKQLPLNALKVDRDFIRKLPSDKANLAITEAIISLCSNLGLQVIAEGVENDAVLKLLRYRRCRLMQGFYLSHPMPSSVFERWFRDPLIPGENYRH